MVGDEYVPLWLKRALIDDRLPWDSARETNVATFLKQYTLHDSNWIGVWITPGSGADAVIRWDAFWSEGRIPHPGPLVAEWPILVIRFPRLYAIKSPPERSDYHDSGIASASSDDVRSGSLFEAETIPPDDHLVETIVQGHFGTTVQLVHGKDVAVLCMTAEGSPLAIPFSEDMPRE
jgi:hypothetical protein